jgi:hypothetical protein
MLTPPKPNYAAVDVNAIMHIYLMYRVYRFYRKSHQSKRATARLRM